MPKLLSKGADAREKILKGVSEVADVVGSTLGPKGRNVILERGYGPTITNDGVTVAESIDFDDPHMKIGADLIKEVARKTNDIAGDGTTTATVLAKAILDGWEQIKDRVNVYEVKHGIDMAVDKVVDNLKKLAQPIGTKEDMAKVATISSLDPEAGAMIAECFDEVGIDGAITVEDGQVVGLKKDVVKGMRIDRGYVSPYLATNASKMEAVHENPPIVLIEKKINNLDEELIPVLEAATSAGHKQMVIIADDFADDVIAMAVLNRLKRIFHATLIKAPSFGERKTDIMKDIAAVVGTKVFSESTGVELKDITAEYFGFAGKVIVSKDFTTFVDGKGEQQVMDDHINELRGQIELETNDHTKDFLKVRLARLTGGVAVIKVGAETETDMRQRKLKIEDAINATRAAIEEGVIRGGGVPLSQIGHSNLTDAFNLTPEEKMGFDILLTAICKPFELIASNAGQTEKDFMATVHEDVIDPVKVTRTALEKAASIAGQLITTEAVVINIEDSNNAPKGGLY